MIGVINLKEICTPQIGTTCLVCDGFIPVDDVAKIHPQVCDECKKRIMMWLYPERELQNE